MKSLFKTALVCGAIFTTCLSPLVLSAHADVIQKSLPKPVGAQSTYDQNANAQLASISNYTGPISGALDDIHKTLLSSFKLYEQQFEINKAALTGPKKTIPFYNSDTEKAARKSAESLSQITISLQSGDGSILPLLKDAFSTYQHRYKLESKLTLAPQGPPEIAERKLATSSLVASGMAAAGEGDIAYNRANVSMERLNGYLTALQSSADLKTSVDLNTRVLIEIAQQNIAAARVSAAQTALLGNYVMFASR